MIRFGAVVCTDLAAGLEREWLETNGLGGFASSTLAGVNTRRYHGLLTAALRPPSSRHLLLSKLEETLVLGDARHELSANQYSGAVHPEGYRWLTEFRLDPFPIWSYRVPGATLDRSLFMVAGENGIVVEYAVRPDDHDQPWTLEVRPLIAFRDFHQLTHRNDALNPTVDAGPNLASIAPYPSLPALHFAYREGGVRAEGCWYYGFQYAAERDRGLDFAEDLYNPFVLSFEGIGPGSKDLVISTQRRVAAQAAERRKAETARRRLVSTAGAGSDWIRELAAAADAFVVARDPGKTVIAGYPWFGDWGRDAMISLPGLTLATGRYDVAFDILRAFAQYVDQGMIPNRFPDAGEAPEYNTVDGTLWMFEAVRFLAQRLNISAFLRDTLYDVLRGIIDHHVRGTRYGIRVDASDGLLACGADGTQLTWMDAKVGDWVVTPRRGKPVEIQALWYHALRIMETLAGTLDDAGGRQRYGSMAAAAARSFNAQFWNEPAGCLFDVVDGDSRDASIRPNQILAVSLLHGMVPATQARRIVEVVQRELLTPYGLRTLSPADPQYRGRYEGDPASRDGAYHQGTVWPWLMGPFLSAYLNVNRRSPARARVQATEWLRPLRSHLAEAGLGQISEIFDGDPPHRPRGCIAQAWSVAELARVSIEEELSP